MNQPSMVVAAAILIALCGCATEPAAPSPIHSNADDHFAAGANRPPTSRTMYALAQIVATQGKDAEAEPLLKEAIRVDPGFMPAYCALAELQMRQRHVDMAIQVVSEGLKHAPSDPILINDLGMCQMINGNPQAALASFTSASALAPDEHRYRANMAMALGLLGRYEEALSLYLQVLSPADAHFNLGVLSESRHDDLHAAEEFHQSTVLSQAEQRRTAELAAEKKETASANAATLPPPGNN